MRSNRRLGEYIDDLPDHLKKDVGKNYGRDELAEKVCRVLSDRLEGHGTVDEIIIGLVKFENAGDEISSRRWMQNKIYRMAEVERILERCKNEDGTTKKGVYQLPREQHSQELTERPPEEEPSENLNP